jgi:hypothetical protein
VTISLARDDAARLLLAHLLFDGDDDLACIAEARVHTGIAPLAVSEMPSPEMGRLLALLREIRAREGETDAVAIRREIHLRAPELADVFWWVASVPCRWLLEIDPLDALAQLRCPRPHHETWPPPGELLDDVIASFATNERAAGTRRAA